MTYGITVIPGVEISALTRTHSAGSTSVLSAAKPDRLAGLLSRTLEQRRISGE